MHFSERVLYHIFFKYFHSYYLIEYETLETSLNIKGLSGSSYHSCFRIHTWIVCVSESALFFTVVDSSDVQITKILQSETFVVKSIYK